MKFISIRAPKPDPGVKPGGKDEVVPDQSLKLKDILDRFTRREALPVGHPVQYGSDSEIEPESDSEFNVDVEKARHWDLTEKAEFGERVAELQAAHDRAQRKAEEKLAEEKAAKDKALQEKRIRIEARKLAKKETGKAGSI